MDLSGLWRNECEKKKGMGKKRDNKKGGLQRNECEKRKGRGEERDNKKTAPVDLSESARE